MSVNRMIIVRAGARERVKTNGGGRICYRMIGRRTDASGRMHKHPKECAPAQCRICRGARP